MKILIIEDEQLLADSIAEVLRRKGFEAEAVYDGETGAEYAELGVYDLLILDVMMPGLDGIRTTAKLRLHRGPAGTRQASGHPHSDAHRPLRPGGPHHRSERGGRLLPHQAF